jgi:hypothetical protein
LHAKKNTFFSIYIFITAKLQKQKSKINQIIDRVAFESFAVFFAVALQLLCSFMHFCKKICYNKALPKPHPRWHDFCSSQQSDLLQSFRKWEPLAVSSSLQ